MDAIDTREGTMQAKERDYIDGTQDALNGIERDHGRGNEYQKAYTLIVLTRALVVVAS